MNTVKTNTLNGQFPTGMLILDIGGEGANFLDYVQKNSPQPIHCIACDIGKGFAEIDKRIWGHLLESLTTKNEELCQK